MRSKIVLRQAFFIFLVTGFALYPVFISTSSIRSGFASFIKNVGALPAQKEVVLPASPIGKPVRLKIPSISVNAVVEDVGLTSKGVMGAPQGPGGVAWFEQGARPGENGSAVIAGHYGVWKNGKGSVFDNLHTLRKGDKIYIQDDKGMIISFVVRESRKYDSEAEASAVFGSNDEKAHLNLITCEGIWDAVSNTYSKRLVVFADRE